METRIPEIYDECMASRAEAVGVLDEKLDWSKGFIFSVLYRDDEGNVQVIMACGIKNADECGPQGVASEDDWINTWYESPLDAHGRSFYRILSDSSFNNVFPSGSGGDSLYTTKVDMNGAEYEILNSNEDTHVSDAFTIQELP